MTNDGSNGKISTISGEDFIFFFFFFDASQTCIIADSVAQRVMPLLLLCTFCRRVCRDFSVRTEDTDETADIDKAIMATGQRFTIQTFRFDPG